MTRGEILARTMMMMADIPYDRWPVATVREELNFCYKEFARRTGLCTSMATAVEQSGTPYYIFPDVNVIRLKQLFVPDLPHIQHMTMEQALHMYGPYFDQLTGTPEHYLWNHKTFTVGGVVRPALLLVPQPLVPYDGSTTTVDGVTYVRSIRAYVQYEPPALALDADIPIIPNEFHERLAEGTCERLYRIDNGYRDNAKAETHAAIFREGIDEALASTMVNKDKHRRRTSPRNY